MNQLFFERADEIRKMQRKLWEIISNNEDDKPDIAIRSISKLHKLSNSLCQMYEMLPVLGRLPSDSFAGIDNNNNDDDNIIIIKSHRHRHRLKKYHLLHLVAAAYTA
jgi:hypothetical protein